MRNPRLFITRTRPTLRIVRWLVALAISSWAFSARSAESTPGELVFQTGFEGESHVVPAGESDHQIVGADTTLSEKNEARAALGIQQFTLQYTGGDLSRRFAKIIPEPGHPTNHVLQFRINDSWPASEGQVKARVQANFYGLKPGYREFYQSVRVFLPADWEALREYPGRIGWLTVAEFWNNIYWNDEPYGFRITLGIGKAAGPVSALHFILDAQGAKMKPIWTAHNEQVAVPIGRWFSLECYFKEGDAQSGRFYVAIKPDGAPRQRVYDVAGWTRNADDPAPAGLTEWNPMKLYTSKEVVAFMRARGKPLEILWDDYALWRNREPADSQPAAPDPLH